MICFFLGYGLTVDKLPRIGFEAVHDLDYLGLVALIVIITCIPIVMGNGEALIIGSPSFPRTTSTIIIYAVVHIIGFRATLVINTL